MEAVSAEVRMGSDGSPIAIKPAGWDDWMEVEEITHAVEVRVLDPTTYGLRRVITTVDRISVLLKNGRPGRLERTHPETEWKFEDQGPASRSKSVS